MSGRGWGFGGRVGRSLAQVEPDSLRSERLPSALIRGGAAAGLSLHRPEGPVQGRRGLSDDEGSDHECCEEEVGGHVGSGFGKEFSHGEMSVGSAGGGRRSGWRGSAKESGPRRGCRGRLAVWPCGPEGLAEARIPVPVPVAASHGPLAVVRGAVAEDGGCLDPGPGPPGPTRLAGSGPGGRIRGSGGHRAPGRVGDEK